MFYRVNFVEFEFDESIPFCNEQSSKLGFLNVKFSKSMICFGKSSKSVFSPSLRDAGLSSKVDPVDPAEIGVVGHSGKHNMLKQHKNSTYRMFSLDYTLS